MQLQNKRKRLISQQKEEARKREIDGFIKKDNYTRTISIGLEWGSYPIQELDGNDYIIDDISAGERGFDDNFCEKVKILQKMYNDLFINNDKEFSYIGNKKPEEIKQIKELYNDIVDEFLNNLKDKFNIKISELDI